ncbi:MAG: hypothetical protein ABSB78_10980 [Bacteroidota bacterium]
MKLIVVVCLVGMIVPSAFSQVKIHETVRIHPQSSTRTQVYWQGDDVRSPIPIDSHVWAYFISGPCYYFEMNGISYGSETPPGRFSELLQNQLYDFGRISAGTVLSGSVGYLTRFGRGYPDPDIILEPVTYQNYNFVCDGSDPKPSSLYLGVQVHGLLDHTTGTFSKDSIEIGEETTLNLQLVSTDGGPIGMSDGVEITVRCSRYAPFKVLDAYRTRVDEMEVTRYYYFQWGNIKNGIRVVADTLHGDEKYRKDSIMVMDHLNYQELYVPIWIRTCIDHYGIICRPDTLNYSDSGKVYVRAEDGNGNEMIPRQPANLLIKIKRPDEGGVVVGAGSIRQMVPKKSKLPMIQSIISGIYPYGYLRSPDGQVGETLSLKSKDIVGVTLFTDDQVYTTGYGQLYVNNTNGILLGETKYYYATEEDGELKIHETTDPTKLPGGGLDDVTFGDPVAAQGSENNPVYWEDQYPTYSGNNFTGSDSLPKGMLRLVGRYWEEGKTYKTKLTANRVSDEKTASIEIEVMKPDSLGNTHRTVIDVFGNSFNLDSIIILYAGKYGIPPQFIKGDVQAESNAFNPSYRWEPFYDAWHIQKNAGKDGTSIYFTDDFQYRIKSFSDKGHPEIPTDHTNLYDGVGRISAYPGYVGTIWEEFYKYCSVVNPSAIKNLYPQTNAHGDTIWYTYPVEIWNKKFEDTKKALQNNENLIDEQKEAAARDTANNWLRYQWQKGIMNTGIAQTRTASSYGLLQMMYPTAHGDRNYPINDNHLPEYLNIADTNFYYAVPFMGMKLDAELVNLSNKTSNWTNGFEMTFLKAYDRYNGATENSGNIGKKGYGKAVLRYSRNYLPKKQ